MRTLTSKEKELWNEAVKKTCSVIKTYDGIIPDERERSYMADRIEKKMAYKLPSLATSRKALLLQQTKTKLKSLAYLSSTTRPSTSWLERMNKKQLINLIETNIKKDSPNQIILLFKLVGIYN